MDTIHRKPAFLQLRDLIFHERDQWADHQCGATPRQTGQLVAKRFARSGGHHEQDVFSLNGSAANGFLVRAEGLEAETLVKNFVEIGGQLGGRSLTVAVLSRRCVFYFADHLANVLFDSLKEWRKLRLPVLNPL